jgi:hypothetical protein
MAGLCFERERPIRQFCHNVASFQYASSGDLSWGGSDLEQGLEGNVLRQSLNDGIALGLRHTRKPASIRALPSLFILAARLCDSPQLRY